MFLKPKAFLLPVLSFCIIGSFFLIAGLNSRPYFDGDRALQDVVFQVNLGPRTPGSQAHTNAVQWIVDELQESDWQVEIQETSQLGHPIRNIIAQRGVSEHWIILCAHYDSRIYADQDPNPENRQKPVPGANDGASGVAVLLELARVLPKDLDLRVWLVFFDAEDQGNIPGWDWILGSTAFVDSLQDKPDAVVLLDMVGDSDQKFPLEQNSTRTLALEIWHIAAQAGYGDIFILETGPSLLDDHIPFLHANISAVDIIDFDYPYWHTLDDTPDKISADSLKAVGDTVLKWLDYRTRQ